MRWVLLLALSALPAAAQDSAFPERRDRSRFLRRVGGSAKTENAVELGLHWLARHQDKDGRWDCDGFDKHDPADDKCTGRGGPRYDTGVTGLALLAFLGAGYTTKSERYKEVVQKGLTYLRSIQDKEGGFGKRNEQKFIYNHALATMAMSEVYGMTRDALLKTSAQSGVAFLVRARNPGHGWRYDPRGGESDTSVTAWCVQALRSARVAGLEVDAGVFADARKWVERVTDGETGRVGYNIPGGLVCRNRKQLDVWPPRKSEAMTSAGILVRLIAGERSFVAPIKKGARLCAKHVPVWNRGDGSIDMDFWHSASLVLFQVGGAEWANWNKGLHTLANSQHPKGGGARTGSWDPAGPWGADGGRVYSTAMLTLCLETYYRYAKGR